MRLDEFDRAVEQLRPARDAVPRNDHLDVGIARLDAPHPTPATRRGPRRPRFRPSCAPARGSRSRRKARAPRAPRRPRCRERAQRRGRGPPQARAGQRRPASPARRGRTRGPRGRWRRQAGASGAHRTSRRLLRGASRRPPSGRRGSASRPSAATGSPISRFDRGQQRRRVLIAPRCVDEEESIPVAHDQPVRRVHGARTHRLRRDVDPYAVANLAQPNLADGDVRRLGGGRPTRLVRPRRVMREPSRIRRETGD